MGGEEEAATGGVFHAYGEPSCSRSNLLAKIPTQLYERVLRGTPEAHRDHLVPADDDDVDALPGLDVADRGRLKSPRKHLRSLLKDENWKVLENIRLIDEVLNTTERVLNPGAHGGDSPLYEHEVQKALDLIARTGEVPSIFA